jgi:hypothetical protein
MSTTISRRRLMQTAPRFESKDTPKLCLRIGDGGPLPEGSPAETAMAAARRLR